MKLICRCWLYSGWVIVRISVLKVKSENEDIQAAVTPKTGVCVLYVFFFHSSLCHLWIEALLSSSMQNYGSFVATKWKVRMNSSSYFVGV